MQEKELKLGGAALNQTPLDWAGNLRRIRQAIKEARHQGIGLLCLPELCLPGYGCEDLFLADWMYDTCEDFIAQLCPDTVGIAVTVGFPIRVEGRRYNAQALLSDGRLVGIALKHHLAGDGVYYEPRWFESWPLGRTVELTYAGQDVLAGHAVFRVGEKRVAFEICEDGWRGPERLAYFYQNKQVDILLNPSASHFMFGKERKRHHLAEQGSRIIGGAYVYVNLVGNESGRLVFDGDVVIYRDGALMAEAEPFSWKEVHVLAEGERSQPAFLAPEAEYELSATLGLYDYMRKSRSKGFCLSLSGGADSACCAILVHRMTQRLHEAFAADADSVGHQLGYWPEALRLLQEKDARGLDRLMLACLYQATENSSADTRAAAQAIAEGTGCTYDAVDVTEQLHLYTREAERILGRTLTWEQDDLALQNIQARVRAPMIWYWTNLRGSLLLTTSNRSEGSVGYSTMDGDMAGGLAPIAGVSKDFVRRWLRFAQEEMGYACLDQVNHLAPTAELRPLETKQTDEADLMPYPLLDRIENLLVYQKLSKDEALNTLVAEGNYEEPYLKSCIDRFQSLWQRNQWKRERLAPSFHLDSYSVDPKTWCRYPILSGS